MRRMCISLLLVAVLPLFGCAAASTAMKYKDLDVQTQMSETIFLDPVAPDKRTIWLDVKNTTDQSVDLSGLEQALVARGYRVLKSPEAESYRLQVNILYAGKASQAAIDTWMGAGFGGPILAGAAIGAGIGSTIGRSPGNILTGMGIGGLIFGVGSLIADSLVKAVTYTVVTDLQLSERSTIPVAQRQTAALAQGSQTVLNQEVADTGSWKRYRARVVSTATKVNLEFEEAKPALLNRLIMSLAGLF